MLEIIAVPVLTDNYVWLIHDADIGETAVVDPSIGDPALEARRRGMAADRQILNTHWHPDHTGGNRRSRRRPAPPSSGPAPKPSRPATSTSVAKAIA